MLPTVTHPNDRCGRGFYIVLYRGSLGIEKLVGYQFVPFSVMLPQGTTHENRKNEIIIPLVDPTIVALEVKLLDLHDQTDAPGSVLIPIMSIQSRSSSSHFIISICTTEV